jgi:hypothetical protein
MAVSYDHEIHANGHIRMSKITAISQEIWKITVAPAGSPQENNTLSLLPLIRRLVLLAKNHRMAV